MAEQKEPAGKIDRRLLMGWHFPEKSLHSHRMSRNHDGALPIGTLPR